MRLPGAGPGVVRRTLVEHEEATKRERRRIKYEDWRTSMPYPASDERDGDDDA